MGKYRLKFDVEIEELEKTNLFQHSGSGRATIAIDIEAKYVYEAVDIFQQYLVAGLNKKIFIPIKLGEEFVMSNKDAKNIIESEVATDEDVE